MPVKPAIGPDMLAMPPIDKVFATSVGTVAVSVYVLLVLALLVWAARDRHKLTVVAAMLIGGMATSVIEPLLDVATGAYHPNLGQPAMFTLMGRSIPAWVVACYGLYYGGLGSLNLLAVSKGITRRAIWLWFLVPLIGDIVLEETMLHFNLYYYYGSQPLMPLKFPLYQPAGNSVGELFCVVALFLLRPALSSVWRWLAAALVVMPLCGVMGFNAVAWPGYYAVHSQWPAIAVQGAGMLCWVLAALLVHVAALLIATDSPLRRTGQLVLP